MQKSIVNFYIVNALGQNLANSESCPILRLLSEAKICNFGGIQWLRVHNFSLSWPPPKYLYMDIFYPKRGIFSPPTTSYCPRSHWMPPVLCVRHYL